MSLADRFKFMGRGKNVPFPFCYSPRPSGFDIAGGLTLAQITKLWWSLELIETETHGNFSISGSNLDIDLVQDDEIGIEPKARVCKSDDWAVLRSVTTTDSSGNPLSFYLKIIVGLDESDPDQFAIFYQIYVESYISGGLYGLTLTNPASDAAFPGTPEFSGTANLDGVPIEWVGGGRDLSTSAWISGATGLSLDFFTEFHTYPPP